MRNSLTLLALAVVFSAPFAPDSLLKGQVTKQFTAYSISESLARNGFGPLSSSLPCEGVRPWVEEPPLFHELGALSLKLGGPPAVVPILAFVFLAVAILRLVEVAVPGPALVAAAAAAAFAPAFCRYSIQHLPELLGVAFLSWGAVFLLRGRRGWALTFFTLSVTTKALSAPAVAGLLVWDAYGQICEKLPDGEKPENLGNLAKGARIAAQLVLVCLPFIVWIGLVRSSGIGSPFGFGRGLMENRHSGGFELLLDPGYYRRLFSWVAIQGAGLVLFAAASAFAVTRVRGWAKATELERMLLFWMATLIPYVLLVRRGNWIHDYYVLPYLPPIAIAGDIFLARLPRYRPAAWALFALAIGNGVASVALLEKVTVPPSQTRPIFCEIEPVGGFASP